MKLSCALIVTVLEQMGYLCGWIAIELKQTPVSLFALNNKVGIWHNPSIPPPQSLQVTRTPKLLKIYRFSYPNLCCLIFTIYSSRIFTK